MPVPGASFSALTRVLRLKGAKKALSLRRYGEEGWATDELYPKENGGWPGDDRGLRRRRKEK
jgi:hypothetical protein